MRTSYHLTPQGLKYVVASKEKNEVRLILMFILQQFSNTAISFDNIQTFYKNDKKKAFKQICYLLDHQLLEIDEDFVAPSDISTSKPSFDEDYVITDMNGLVVDYHGYKQHHAQQISIDAIDFIRVSRRNRETVVVKPISVETPWQDKTVTTYHLFLKGFSILLSCKTQNIFEQTDFISLISYFCNRYNYE